VGAGTSAHPVGRRDQMVALVRGAGASSSGRAQGCLTMCFDMRGSPDHFRNQEGLHLGQRCTIIDTTVLEVGA
jgi:hypothetical protein